MQKVSVFGVDIATKNFDLCKSVGITCPKAPGPWDGKIVYKIPSSGNFQDIYAMMTLSFLNSFHLFCCVYFMYVAPTGISANAEITVADASGNSLDCMDMKIKTGKKSLFDLLTRYPMASREIQFLFEAWRLQHKKTFESAEEYMKNLDMFAANMTKYMLN